LKGQHLLLSGLAVFVLSAAVAASAPARSLQAATVAGPQVVLDWNATAAATLLASGKPQPESMVYIGLTQVAVYDAVIAIEGGFEPYLVVPGVPPGSSPEAAAAAAAHGVLVTYFPAQKPALDAAYAASLAGIADGPAEDRGVLVGQQVAAGLVAARIDDGRDDLEPFTPTPEPGVWRPTPPAFLAAQTPWMATMKPLLLRSAAQFRPGPPPALESVRYARGFEEVRLYGAKNGSLRTVEQTETARFWTELVQQQHNRTLRNLVTRLGLDLRETTRALALGTTVMADSLIACWDAKFAYGYWRPVTAIPAGDTDGNRRTAADPAWEPLAPTPNHPEYPSAHTCVTAALGAAAAALVGRDRIDLDVSSTVTGTTRHFSHVNDLERDIENARVYIGYHWRNSGEVGSRLAERVARWSLKNYFRPTNDAKND
jgi:VCPO second helical-bundle domain